MSKPLIEAEYWDEMCRREEWDRAFERNFPYTDEDKKTMEKWKEEEDRSREEWDAKYRDTHALQADGGSNSILSSNLSSEQDSNSNISETPTKSSKLKGLWGASKILR